MKFSKFFVPFFFYQALYAAGFASETYILTASGSVPMSELSDDALVIGLKENAYLCCAKIAYKGTSTASELVKITVGSLFAREKIYVTPDQQFCLLDGSWVKACRLERGDVVRGCPGAVEIKNAETISVDADTVVCTVALDDEFGCFYISRHKLLAYNFTSQKIWKPTKRVTKKAGKAVLDIAVTTAEIALAALIIA